MPHGKTIYIFRHGKASPGDAAMEDHDRPLLPQGEQAAQLIGNYMKWKSYYPSHALCSTAARTRQTLELLLPVLGKEIPVEFTKKLYLASAGDIFHQLQKLPEKTTSVLVVGHNPGLHQFCLKLVNEGEEKKMDDLAVKFPTCALAVIDVKPKDWSALSPHSGTLRDLVFPKSL